MGGGGFSMEPGNPLFDEYILNQSPTANPKICLLPTASGDHPEYIDGFYDYFTTKHCRPSHLPLVEPLFTRFEDLEDFVLDQHIIYVTGGHTGHMLALWQELGIDLILGKAWEKGIILAGVSAGASCWFEMGLTDSVPDQLTGEPCLGFLRGSHCAHYENVERRPTFHRLVAAEELPEGYGTDNFAALHFIDDALKKVVASRPGAASHFVSRVPGGVREKRMEGKYLGEYL
jgi:peptidase E